jgi:uncharacterized protein YggE
VAVDDLDALKALVDDALSRGVHSDAQVTLGQWREEHTTDEERDAALTDDERAAKEAKQAEESKQQSVRTAPRKA